MDWDKITERVANLARPFGIYFLSGSSGVYLLTKGSDGALTIVAGLAGIFIGARSAENITQTRADASVRTSQTIATLDKTVITDKQGQPSKPATDIKP